MASDYWLLAGDRHACGVRILHRAAPARDSAHLIRRLPRDSNVVRRAVGQRCRQHELAVRGDRELGAVALQLQARAVQPGYRAADAAREEVATADLDIRDVRVRNDAGAVRYVALLQRQNRRIRYGDVVARTAEHRGREGKRPIGGRVEPIAVIVGDDHPGALQIADRAADRELAQRAGDYDVVDVAIRDTAAAVLHGARLRRTARVRLDRDAVRRAARNLGCKRKAAIRLHADVVAVIVL